MGIKARYTSHITFVSTHFLLEYTSEIELLYAVNNSHVKCFLRRKFFKENTEDYGSTFNP